MAEPAQDGRARRMLCCRPLPALLWQRVAAACARTAFPGLTLLQLHVPKVGCKVLTPQADDWNVIPGQARLQSEGDL